MLTGGMPAARMGNQTACSVSLPVQEPTATGPLANIQNGAVALFMSDYITLQRILADHPEAKRAGNDWLIRCPAHDDRDPSLSIGEGEGGQLLFHCHAGCSQEEVMKGLGFGGTGASVHTNGVQPYQAPRRPVHDTQSSANGKSPQEAQSAFERLPLAWDDEQARAFLKADYGLALDDIPKEWRVYEHRKHGPGIVYPGNAADGSPIFKYKSFARKPENGKRYIVFLYGTGGALVMAHGPDRPWVIVAGEEKAAAARAAGFNVFCPLTGEHVLTDGMIELVLDPQTPLPSRIIMANDKGDGDKANRETPSKLERSGFPADKILVVAWAADAPDGFDLNDLLKAGGADAVRRVLETALPFESSLPRCLSATDFIASNRPPLVYHIEGILPYEGKLTFSATAKFGKSMWAIQTGLALAAGNCRWLGWKFGPPARVLYVQAEIMDAMLEARVRMLMETMPAGLDHERAGRNFLIHEITRGHPNLMTTDGRAVVEALLIIHRPDVLILDPLTALHPGLEENEAAAMGTALNYLYGLTLRFGCAVVLVHHHSKTGAARGSSVFEAWPESDLQASYLSDNDRSIAKVTARLRCVYNPGPVYWRMPTPESPWFMRMPDGWEPDRKGRKSTFQSTIAQMALQASPKPMKWSELKKAIRNVAGCGERKAEELIAEASSMGLISKDAGFYVASNPSPQKDLP